mgnify:FL=1|jgi:hypothetical protein
MSGHQLRLSSVYSLLILIPLLAACQSDNERDVAYSDIEPADNVLQAGSANQLNDDQAVQMSGNGPDEEQSSPESSLLRLLGLRIHDPMDAVADEYGRATEQFTMVDGSDVIVVHSYPGFMVGYNEQKQIHFIDVYSAEINPGLGGITIGSSLDDALEKLGEPDQLTSSVLMYERDGSVLKLDIDQTTGTIVSIKLFASDE